VWFLAFFAVAAFAFALHTEASSGLLRHFGIGTLFGVVYSAGALFWLWDLLPITWAGIPETKGFALVYLYWGSASAVLGIFFGVFALLYRVLRTENPALRILFAASAWTLLQYAQMWAFAALMAGNENGMAAHFSATMLGYALSAFSPLLYLAQFGGVYGLTFTVVLIGFAAEALMGKYAPSIKVKVAAVVLAVVACISVTLLDTKFHIVPSSPDERGVLNMGAITTDFFPKVSLSKAEVTERGRQIGELLGDVSDTVRMLDVLIIPSGEFLSASGVEPTSVLKTVLTGNSPKIIDVATMETSAGTYKRLTAYSSDGEIVASHNTTLLAPVAEYPVYLFSSAQSYILGEHAARKNSLPVLHPGTTPQPLPLGDMKIGALLCAEIFSPSLYADLSNSGAQILINVCPDSWLHHGFMSTQMLIAHAKLRAVESGRYVAMVHNGASSAVVSDAGEVIARTPVGGISFMTAAGPLLGTRTAYSRLGESVLAIPLLLFLFTAASVVRKSVVRLKGGPSVQK
jgi:apolipoprotein N-acyltransferase